MHYIQWGKSAQSISDFNLWLGFFLPLNMNLPCTLQKLNHSCHHHGQLKTGWLLMLLPKCQSSSHTWHCLGWSRHAGLGHWSLSFPPEPLGEAQTLMGSFSLNHFPIRQAFSLCRGTSSPWEYCRYSGAAGRKEEWIFYHIKHFHSIFVIFFTSSVLFYSRHRESSTRLQGVKRLAWWV